MQQNLGKYYHVRLAALAYQMLDELGLTCVQSSFIKDPVAAIQLPQHIGGNGIGRVR